MTNGTQNEPTKHLLISTRISEHDHAGNYRRPQTNRTELHSRTTTRPLFHAIRQATPSTWLPVDSAPTWAKIGDVRAEGRRPSKVCYITPRPTTTKIGASCGRVTKLLIRTPPPINWDVIRLFHAVRMRGKVLFTVLKAPSWLIFARKMDTVSCGDLLVGFFLVGGWIMDHPMASVTSGHSPVIYHVTIDNIIALI